MDSKTTVMTTRPHRKTFFLPYYYFYIKYCDLVGNWTQTYFLCWESRASYYTTQVILRRSVSIWGPPGYEPGALPLRHAAMVQTGGFEPPRPKPLDLKTNPLDLLGQVCYSSLLFYFFVFVFVFCFLLSAGNFYDLPRHRAHSIWEECRNGNRTHIRSLSWDLGLLYVSIIQYTLNPTPSSLRLKILDSLFILDIKIFE